MDPDRARILADLSGVLDGQIRCDDLFLQLYSSDASLYEIKPLAVVRPETLTDVVSVVKYATENQLSVICLLYTSPSPRDQRGSRMPSSA